MAKMSAINTDCLAIGETSYVFPKDFLISETWPSMILALQDKLFQSPPDWCFEKRFTCDWIVVGGHWSFFARFLGVLSQIHLFLDPSDLRHEGVPCMLCIMSIIAAYPICRLKVAAIFEILLNRVLCWSMSFLWHDWLVAQDREALSILLHTNHRKRYLR